jgi:uncharacterized protein (DUF2252 family)
VAAKLQRFLPDYLPQVLAAMAEDQFAFLRISAESAD